ncbi:Uncharacterized protein Adt_48261 [Abeliophyllum distichum]|uniref:Uncharacterized protein n=1 Tax=Abeliophyllum distichum TaxID=126358 RepID=A0ABD1NSB2_9LAMI
MEQCRQGKSAKWIRNLGKRIGSEGWARGVPVPNPSAVGGLLELLPRRERVAACRPGGRTGNGSFGGPSPGVEQSTQNCETTAKGTGLAESAGKEDPVELDSSPTL